MATATEISSKADFNLIKDDSPKVSSLPSQVTNLENLRAVSLPVGIGVSELSDANESAVIRRRMLSLLNKDYKVSHLYLLPLLKSFQPSIDWMSRQTGLDHEEVFDIIDQLLAADLWRRLGSSFQVTKEDLPEKETSIQEFRTLSTNLIASMSENGPCAWDAYVVATTEELKKEFLNKITDCVREFTQKSVAVQAEIVVAWNQGFLNCTKLAQKNESLHRQNIEGEKCSES